MALLSPALSAAAGAQTIAGRAVDGVTQLAAPDIGVQVLSERDSVVSRMRTNNAGEFYTELPSPGTFHLRFVLDSLNTIDSAPVTVGAGGHVQQLFVIDAARILYDFPVDKPVEQAPNTVRPRYPDAMRGREIDGEVMAQFVVDTTGLVLLETFRPIRYTNMEFVQAVREALPQLRYIPAEKGGRRVIQLVRQPFTFGLSERPLQRGPGTFDPPPGRGAASPTMRPWP
jgi:hypothetical protein